MGIGTLCAAGTSNVQQNKVHIAIRANKNHVPCYLSSESGLHSTSATREALAPTNDIQPPIGCKSFQRCKLKVPVQRSGPSRPSATPKSPRGHCIFVVKFQAHHRVWAHISLGNISIFARIGKHHLQQETSLTRVPQTSKLSCDIVGHTMAEIDANPSPVLRAALAVERNR